MCGLNGVGGAVTTRRKSVRSHCDDSVRILSQMVYGSIPVEIRRRRAQPLHETSLRPAVSFSGLAQPADHREGLPVRPELKPRVDEAVALPHGDKRVVAVRGGGELRGARDRDPIRLPASALVSIPNS